ncbi:xylulokinase [Egicoccus sp. AB-alg2]|uniref:xylulokinase n=1 Tax=Egicoccus sp. AB-alg2 TaxID=3242693 RepID=UPI00359CEC83
MGAEVVAGIDCSTQQTKVVVVDAATGEVLATTRAPHEVHGRDGARETDPAVWHAALAGALAQTGMADEIAAIAVGGQQHGLVVTDRAGAPLRPAMLWNDVRSAPQARHLVEQHGGTTWWAQQVGVVPVPSVTVTKWRWLREHEPEVAARAERVQLPHDWLTGRLTGEATTDRGDASGTGWWSSIHERYHDGVLGASGIELDVAALPRVVGPREQAGETTADAARDFGLRAGVPVAAGTGDNMAAALGLGLGPGTPVLSLGTSGTAYARSTRPASDPSGTVAGFADATGRFLPLACTLNCTLAVDRMADWLGLDRDEVSERSHVVVLPFLDGERTPNLPEASGLVVGLRHDTSAGEILRAAYEGAVASLIEALDAIDRHSSGVDPDAPLVLIGGGAKGATWRDVVQRLSGRALRIPAEAEHVALGAAAQAAGVLSGEEPSVIARRWGHGAGHEIDPVTRGDDTLERIVATRTAASFLLRGPGG